MGALLALGRPGLRLLVVGLEHKRRVRHGVEALPVGPVLRYEANEGEEAPRHPVGRRAGRERVQGAAVVGEHRHDLLRCEQRSFLEERQGRVLQLHGPVSHQRHARRQQAR